MQALHLREQLELVCLYSLGSFSSEKFAAFGLAFDTGLGIECFQSLCALVGAREGVSSTEVCRLLAVLGWSFSTHLVQTTASVKAVRAAVCT